MAARPGCERLGRGRRPCGARPRADARPLRGAAQRWVDEGHDAPLRASSPRTTPSSSTRGSGSRFGASARCAIQRDRGRRAASTAASTDPTEERRTTFPMRLGLELAMSESMVPAPSFSGIVTDESHDEVLAEWRRGRRAATTTRSSSRSATGRSSVDTLLVPPAAGPRACRSGLHYLAQVATDARGARHRRRASR